MKYPVRRGIRARIVERLKKQVRLWAHGHQMTYFDSPEGVRMDFSYPSYPTMRVLEALPADAPRIQVGKYAGVHYTSVFIPGGQHHFDWVAAAVPGVVENGMWDLHPGSVTSRGPIIVGNDAFVGFEAIVSSGVTIGDGAVVGSRAVVTRNVEPYSIVVGNPAQHVKYRFDEPTREGLLRIRWWDWPETVVAAHRHQLHNADAAGFVERHDPERGVPSCDVCQELGHSGAAASGSTTSS